MWHYYVGGGKAAPRTVLHHLLQKFDDHLRGGPHENLALAALLSVEAADAIAQRDMSVWSMM